MAAKMTHERFGIFGGTFDPPHVGHLIIAEEARQQLELTKVIFVPAFLPPHKPGERSATALQRYRMVMHSVRGNPFFEVSQLELKRKGMSYTVDTLQAVKKRHPSAELFLILGSDNLVDFRTWKSPEEILTLASLAAYERKGFDIDGAETSAQLRAIRLTGVHLDISSSLIRKHVRMGKSVRYLVPDAVHKFIKKNKLYTVPRSV
ncbi:MAG: nicotinate-nucleotide adenylyltransferase [Ignavibacteriales bacterium]|nr:nicotinate-nucleotide adenylyltransferase [Ignavibacteriales bacterium]